MKLIDFGKNSYQCEINFKFDCIALDVIRDMVEGFFVSKKYFSTVAKDATTNQTILTRGIGTKEDPFFQLKVGPDKIILWGGWYIAPEKWQEWRGSLLSEIIQRLKGLSPELIGYLTSQCAFAVPIDKLKPPEQIPEFQSIRALYDRFIPGELLKRGAVFLTFGDEQGSEVLTCWIGGSTTPTEENITFNLRKNTFDSKTRLEQNLLAHIDRADHLLERFSSGFLSLFTKI